MEWNTFAVVAVATLAALDIALRVVFCLRVIMSPRPAPFVLTWVIALALIPVLSPFIFLLLGEPTLGRGRARQYERSTRRIEAEAVLHWQRSGLTWTPPASSPYAGLARLATSASGMPPLIGNSIELLGTGAPLLQSLIRDIDAAKHHCHLLYYIWQPAEAGNGLSEQVSAALIRAAARGVECRVLVDAVGSRQFLASSQRQELEAAGVEVLAALPVGLFRSLFARADLRNHRKVAVIDARIAYCGSQNLTDETFAFRRRAKTGPWIDATVRLQGPAVQALQSVFLRDWRLDLGQDLGDVQRFFDLSAPAHPGNSTVHVLPSGPGPQADAIHQALLGLLYGAREEIIITTPYFVPDEATRSALINAALRGVDVTLVLPDVLDARVVAAASRSHYDSLLRSGIRIVHHMEGLLHAKTATVDRSVSMVGSANLDTRSFWLNFEATLFIYDPAFTHELRFMQRHYMNESEPVHLSEWRRRPYIARLTDNIARMFSPLL